MGKSISKSESVMDLNSDSKHDSKVKKTVPDSDAVSPKPFGTIGKSWFFYPFILT